MKPGQFSLRAIFLATALVAAVIGGLLALGKACMEADHQAHLQAIRDGRLSLESEKENISAQDYDSLKAELATKH